MLQNVKTKVGALILNPKTRGALMMMALASLMMVTFGADQNFGTTVGKTFQVIYTIVQVVGAGIFIAGLAQVAMGLLGGAEGQSYNSGLVKIAAGAILFAIPSVLKFIGFDPTAIGAQF